MVRFTKYILACAMSLCAMMSLTAVSASAQDNVVPAAPAAAAAPAELDYSVLPEPMAFVKAQYAEALRLNALPQSAERDKGIKDFVDALVNYDELAQRTLGNKWSSLDESKQVEFKTVFRELFELTYLKKISDKSFKENYKLDWDRVVKTKKAATVSCFTKQKDVETELESVLHAENGHWIIYDVLVDGASLAKTYQKKYAKQIDSSTIDGLLADMRKEIEKLKK